MTKELEIGEELRIRCVKSKGFAQCEKCICNLYGISCELFACSSEEREDETNVYYELVED